MEINTEINKVFGQEMAKVFASTISEEELKTTARQVWLSMNSTKNWESPEIIKYIKSEYLKRMLDAIKGITETEEFKNDLKIRSKQIVKEITEETEKKMVEEISNRMAALSTGYSGYGIRSIITDMIGQELNHR